MGLFKKKKDVSPKTNSFGEPLDKLVDGELPWGWVSANREFTAKISSEFDVFLHDWIDSRKLSPREQYAALKSLVLYLNDVKKLCYSKGECFAFWFSEILTSNNYLSTITAELNELEQNIEQLQNQYETKKIALNNIDSKIIMALKNNDGILQSDFVKLFDPSIQVDVKNKLYYMEKEGKVVRIKSGRSYTLHLK